MRRVALILGVLLVGTVFFFPIDVPSSRAVAQSPQLGKLFVSGGSNADLVKAYDLDAGTPLSTTFPTLPGVEDIACGPDGRVYAALTGYTGAARKIVRFKQDGANPETVLDVDALPSGHPLKNSGGPEAPSFEVLVQDDGRAVPSGRLAFNTRFTSAQRPHTGVWMMQPQAGSIPFQVISPIVTTGGTPPFWGEGTVFLTTGPFQRHLLAVERTNARIVRRGPPFDSAVTGTDYILNAPQFPNGIVVDGNGNILVTHRDSGDITRWLPTSPTATPSPGPGQSGAVFANVGLTPIFFLDVDAANNIYVPVSISTGDVRKVTPSGQVSTLAGFTVPFGVGAAVCARRIPMAIDIKPGSFPNRINPKSRGVIPVAILTTPAINAPAAVASATTPITFGPTGVEATALRCAQEDVDNDGDTDVVCHFDTQQVFSTLPPGTPVTELRLQFGNQDFEGRGSIELF